MDTVPLELTGSIAGEIKRHPEVEMLPAAVDSRADPMRKIPTWLTEGAN
jgi:hypothetical protein